MGPATAGSSVSSSVPAGMSAAATTNLPPSLALSPSYLTRPSAHMMLLLVIFSAVLSCGVPLRRDTASLSLPSYCDPCT